jgi:hypothetical protein
LGQRSQPAEQRTTEQHRFAPDLKPHRKSIPGATKVDERKAQFLTTLRSGYEPEVSSSFVPRIILRLEVVNTQGPNRRFLCNVLTGFCPMD